jgi:hypothetical protein
MIQEQLDYGIKLQNTLKKYKDSLAILTNEPLQIAMETRYKGSCREFSNSPSNENCPDILKEELNRDLMFVKDRLVANIKRIITELETEFNNL